VKDLDKSLESNKYHAVRLISRFMAHCTASSTFSASWVGLWAGGPSSRSYTPVRTSTDDQPAAFAPAMSADGAQGWREVRRLVNSKADNDARTYPTLDCLCMAVSQKCIKRNARGLTSNHIAGYAEH